MQKNMEQVRASLLNYLFTQTGWKAQAEGVGSGQCRSHGRTGCKQPGVKVRAWPLAKTRVSLKSERNDCGPGQW